jgi:pyrroline-5-carboxylate reductase
MTLKLQGPLLLAGAGKMGGAILTRLLEGGLDPQHVIVQDPEPSAEIGSVLADYAIDVVPVIDELSSPPAIILIAVKPQIMDKVLPGLAKLAGPDTLVVTVAAGRRIAGFEAELPESAAVVRAMPNMPAAIGRGVTVACANRQVTPVQKARADELLSAVGDVLWVADEDLLDPVTAVSGSGPAYVFRLVECLAEAGQAAGLDPKMAYELARGTVVGAAALLEGSELDAAALRAAVTSPGGTTAAALDVLNGPAGLRDLMTKAVAAATERGRELAK